MPVETLDNIPRRPLPSAEAFRRQVVEHPDEPVIYTGAFEGQPMAALRTLEDFKRVLGDLPLEIKENYLEGTADLILRYSHGERPTTKFAKAMMTVSSYLDFIETNPNTTKMAADLTPPPELAALYEVPPHFKLSETDPLYSVFFVSK